MKLVNYGAGEVADRLTILALKLLVGKEQGKPIDHFRNERNALVTQLNAREVGPWLEHLFDLAGVNAMLWHAEDDLRAYRDGPKGYLDALQEVATLAFRIQSLNDRRAELVALINEKAGDGISQEKLT